MNSAIAYRFDKDIPVDAWVALFRASAYNKKWKGERNAKAALSYAWLVVTAWDGQKSVGTVTVYSDGVNSAIIDDLLVHPDYRGKGIGSALIRAALERIGACHLDVQLYPIPGRESFFARFGFVVQPKATVMDLVRDHQ
jgi:GNAT superfamily N-acetyltransferase